jgi:TrmH family RNA methyltransferase
MLTEEQRERVCVVLVRARNPNNIGAVARAMHGFGFADLRLVNEYSVAIDKARSAVDASAILAGAREFVNVGRCGGRLQLVVGTTAVGERKQEHPLYSLAEAGGLLHAELASPPRGRTARVALLFGSEKTGLSNEALSHCHWLMTIPMHRNPDLRHASMNLGQAAAVCLYELIRQADAPPLSKPRPGADAEDLERLTKLLEQVLGCIGYARRRPASADRTEVRRMVRRMGLNQSDARRWIGILRQLLWKLGQKPPR